VKRWMLAVVLLLASVTQGCFKPRHEDVDVLLSQLAASEDAECTKEVFGRLRIIMLDLPSLGPALEARVGDAVASRAIQGGVLDPDAAWVLRRCRWSGKAEFAKALLARKEIETTYWLGNLVISCADPSYAPLILDRFRASTTDEERKECVRMLHHAYLLEQEKGETALLQLWDSLPVGSAAREEADGAIRRLRSSAAYSAPIRVTNVGDDAEK